MPGFISEIMRCIRKDKLYNEIVEKHYNRIYKYCHYRLYQDKFLAEECTQDVFVTLYKNMETLDNFDTIDRWLYKTAENFVRRALVKSARELKRFSYVDNIEDVADSAKLVHEDRYERLDRDRTDVSAYLKRIFDNLSEMDIKIWDLYYKQQKSQQEVANDLELSLSAVKSRTSRLKHKITLLAHALLEDAG